MSLATFWLAFSLLVFMLFEFQTEVLPTGECPTLVVLFATG